jgi:hypothetical protein
MKPILLSSQHQTKTPPKKDKIDAKILKKIMANQIQHTSERSSTMTKLASSQGCRGGSTYTNL